MHEVLPHPNSFVELVNKLEQCCNDGIDCGHCPVAAQCTACWDSVCQQQDEDQYVKFTAHLAKLRDNKWTLAAGSKRRR